MRGVLQKDVTRPAHVQTICAAYGALVELVPADENGAYEYAVDPAKWDDFVQGLSEAPLSKKAAEIRDNPKLCE